MGEKGECEKGPPERNQQFRPFSPGASYNTYSCDEGGGGGDGGREDGWRGRGSMPPQPPLNSDGQNGETNAATFVSSRMLHLRGPFFISFLFWPLSSLLPPLLLMRQSSIGISPFPCPYVFNTGDAPPVFALRRVGDRAGRGVTSREGGRP